MKKKIFAIISTVLALFLFSTGVANAAPPVVYGGDFMSTPLETCTAGIPVHSPSGQWYLLTAGHCLVPNMPYVWKTYPGNKPIGKGFKGTFGAYGTEHNGWDYGIIRSSSPLKSAYRTANSRVYNFSAPRDAGNNQRVCVVLGRSKVTRCGIVRNNNTTLSYGAPHLSPQNIKGLAIVEGLCGQSGDSGSPVVIEHTNIPVGIFVASSTATNYCYGWYTRLPTVLNKYKLSVG